MANHDLRGSYADAYSLFRFWRRDRANWDPQHSVLSDAALFDYARKKVGGLNDAITQRLVDSCIKPSPDPLIRFHNLVREIRDGEVSAEWCRHNRNALK